MVNQQLLDYIKQQIAAGVSRDAIKSVLLAKGWTINDAEEAFVQAASGVPPSVPPSEPQNFNSAQTVPTLAGVGALFASAFVTFRKRFWPIVLLWLIGAVYSLIAVVPAGILYAVSKAVNVNGILFFGIGLVIAVAGLFWIIYVFLRVTLSQYLLIASPEGSLTAWGAWKASSGKVRSFFWVGALSSLVGAGGFVLLIVPGIIVSVMVIFAVWVMAIEGLRGRAALLRSRSYVKGRWWKIFWRLIVIAILGLLLSFVFLGLGRILGQNIVFSVVDILANILWGIFGFCYAYQLYASAKASAQIDPAAETAAKKKYTVLAVLGLLLPVLGLLAGIALVSLNSARDKSRDAMRIANVRQIQTALEFYYNDTNQYPQSLNGLIPNYINNIPS
ncbi:MAG: hypothetical protein U1E51_33735, partial [Candidatus Binatia bacterium]|nr:hypothetical protein [Candidatus Binatia bacterium]